MHHVWGTRYREATRASHPPPSLHPVQDWLNDETYWVSYLTQSATLGRQWLMQMGSGADKSGIAVQYCMSMPRHIMQSVEVPAMVRALAGVPELLGF